MRILVLPAALSLMILLAACASDTGEGGDLDVVLDEYSVVTDVDALPEGPIKFDITNDGAIDHDLLIVRSDIPGAELPTEDDGSFDEDAGGVDVEREINDLEPSAETSRSYDLDPGKYVLLCNIVDGETSHYDLGMWTEITITPEE